MSCPSCGRTLFDLQEISAEIREKTSHLPGVSVIRFSQLCMIRFLLHSTGPEFHGVFLFPSSQIAIMGCIVNGPGEMADADFGYVGGAPGKIDLYVGKVIHKFMSFHAHYALSSPSNLLLLLRSSTCSLWH